MKVAKLIGILTGLALRGSFFVGYVYIALIILKKLGVTV
jgi:hypothetical protein